MGSRVHGAASACLVASGLFLCGLGGALALAEPSAHSETPLSIDMPLKGPKGDSDGNDGSKESTGKDQDTQDTADEHPGNGGNPDNGNCGNDGSNGNARHCGGGTETSPPGSSTTKTTTETSTSTKTTTSRTTTSRTTSTETTTSKTTSTETTTSGTTSTQTTTSRTTSTPTSETTSTPTSETTSTETSEPTSTSTPGPGLPAPGGGGGGGGGIEVPSGRPELPPPMQLPAELMPPVSEPPVIDVVPGVGAAAVEVPIPPIALPVIVAPAAGAGGAGAPAAPVLPGTPRGVSAEPPAGREPLPANADSNIAMPASSYRIGYTDYLRSAGLPQVAALAVPGIAGMLVLTGAGGFVVYRQAKAAMRYIQAVPHGS